MKTRKLTAILISLILLGIATGESVEKPAEGIVDATPTISNTRTASCLVKLTADVEFLPLDFDTIDYLLHSSGVYGKAAREILGISVDNNLDLFHIRIPATKPVPMLRRPLRGKAGSTYRFYEEFMNGFKADDTSLDEAQRLLKQLQQSEIPTIAKLLANPPNSLKPQTILFGLEVELPEDIKPAAEEFMNALTDNFRKTTEKAFHHDYRGELNYRLSLAETQRSDAREQLSKTLLQNEKMVQELLTVQTSPENASVYSQLDEIVNLSDLPGTLSFTEVLEELKKSVDPPLKIWVNWRDLIDNAEIEQATPINIDFVSPVPLGTTLKLLLESILSGFGEIGYSVENGMVIIATKESLPKNLKTQNYTLPGLVDIGKLVEIITETVEPDTWFDAGGEGTISVFQNRQLVINQTQDVHQKIVEFLQNLKYEVPVETIDFSMEISHEEKQNMLRFKHNLEVDIAGIEARHSVIEEQIIRIKREIIVKVEDDSITNELQKIVDLQLKRFKSTQAGEEGQPSSSAALADAEEKLARAKVEIARRREEIGKSAGGNELAKFNSQLTTIMIDLAEKKARLRVVSEQLEQTEEQLSTVAAFDPQVSQIRAAKEAFEIAENRFNKLKIRIANLQPPTINIIGGK